jgi:hypothetical protein
MNATTKGNGEMQGFDLAEKLAAEGAAKTATGKSLPKKTDVEEDIAVLLEEDALEESLADKMLLAQISRW